MRLRRNSVRNHDVKKRDHLLAFGVEDQVMGGCSRSFLHFGRLRLHSGAMWMTQFNLSSDDQALESIVAVWGVAGQHWLRGMEGAAVMHGCGQYLADVGHHPRSGVTPQAGGYYYYTPVAAGTDPFFLLFTQIQ